MFSAELLWAMGELTVGTRMIPQHVISSFHTSFGESYLCKNAQVLNLQTVNVIFL